MTSPPIARKPKTGVRAKVDDQPPSVSLRFCVGVRAKVDDQPPERLSFLRDPKPKEMETKRRVTKELRGG